MSKLKITKGLTTLFQSELRSENEKPFQSKIENFFVSFFNFMSELNIKKANKKAPAFAEATEKATSIKGF